MRSFLDELDDVYKNIEEQDKASFFVGGGGGGGARSRGMPGHGKGMTAVHFVGSFVLHTRVCDVQALLWPSLFSSNGCF